MEKYWISWIFLSCMLVPSMQVMISPCQVETIMTQPHHATSLTKKHLVQIVQIPPVFIQKVMVSRCSNATPEVSLSPGNHFICKQRYSAVEVYIMENPGGISDTFDPKPTFQSIMERFKNGHFFREFVVVESGCDFSYNLLPLIVQKNKEQTRPSIHNNDGGPPHSYHFLRSPYHTNNQYSSSTSSQQVQNLELVNSHNVNPYHQTQSPSSVYPILTTPNPATAYTQGGNANNWNVPNGQASIGLPSSYNNVGPDSSPTSSVYYQPRGSYGGGGREDSSVVQGRGKSGQVPQKPESSQNYHSEAKQSYHQNSIPTSSSYEPEPELYHVSDKIGLPLYILSPQVDPLLRNIETIDSQHHSN